MANTEDDKYSLCDYSLNDYKKNAPENAHQKRRIDLINRLFDKVPKLGKGLDYGCGLGDLTFRLSPKFENIIGVDVDDQRVQWANVEFAPISFFQCDGDTLDFPDNSFDTVLSSVVINWVNDPEQYLTNIHRTLIPGGHLVLLVKAPNKVRSYLRKLLGKKPMPDSRFDLKEMEILLSQTGFDVLNVDCYYSTFGEVFITIKNILVELLTIPMRLLGRPEYASYYGILAIRNN